MSKPKKLLGSSSTTYLEMNLGTKRIVRELSSVRSLVAGYLVT